MFISLYVQVLVSRIGFKPMTPSLKESFFYSTVTDFAKFLGLSMS